MHFPITELQVLHNNTISENFSRECPDYTFLVHFTTTLQNYSLYRIPSYQTFSQRQKHRWICFGYLYNFSVILNCFCYLGKFTNKLLWKERSWVYKDFFLAPWLNFLSPLPFVPDILEFVVPLWTSDGAKFSHAHSFESNDQAKTRSILRIEGT